MRATLKLWHSNLAQTYAWNKDKNAHVHFDDLDLDARSLWLHWQRKETDSALNYLDN